MCSRVRRCCRGIPLGFWSSEPQVRNALLVCPLFFLGIAAAIAMQWCFRATRMGLRVRIVGDSQDAALALGLPIDRTRLLATAAGSALAGIGGAFLSLYYPGSWNEGLSSGQGLMAVALVVFARWNPINCIYRLAAVRRGRRARPVVADGRHHLGLLPVLRGALRRDADRADHQRATVRPGALRGMPGELSIGR